MKLKNIVICGKLILVAGLLLCPAAMHAGVWGALWSGPATNVTWQGLDAPAERELPKPAKMELSGQQQDKTPRWVGYVKRNRDEWWLRLVLWDDPTGARSEMVKRGGMTSDGWQVTDIDAQANRPTRITVEKEGVQKTLELTTLEPASSNS